MSDFVMRGGTAIFPDRAPEKQDIFVGYCDVFLTDGPLHSMLQQRHMKMADYFSCKIVTSPEEAAAMMSS